jgi:Orsellinic acid/F9775 biosynthesis cluster protein D
MTPAPLDTTISSNKALELPAGLHLNAALKMLICSTHNSCYTNNNYRRHLLDLHRIKGALLKSYCQIIDAADLHASPNDIPRPINTPLAIAGLKVQSGFNCGRYGYLNINRGIISKYMRVCGRNSRITQLRIEEMQAIQSL